jgi:hypothetical protein
MVLDAMVEMVEMRPLVTVSICERGGRMPHGIAGEGPAKEIAGSGREGIEEFSEWSFLTI